MKDKVMVLKMEDKLHEALKDKAHREGMSMGGLLRKSLRRYLKQCLER